MRKRYGFDLPEQERKVHFFHDQGGATIGESTRPFANTLCRMNSDVPRSHITTDVEKVTCRICQKDARFKALYRGLTQREAPAAPTVPEPATVSALRTRHRVGFRGRLVLQVCETYPINSLGHTRDHWRDAKLSDLNIGVV